MKITASHIEGLLAEKHSSDIFVPQCKNGPTHVAEGLLIMDAWAMKPSWMNPRFVGYEIKVSRSDFLNDDKWPGYLDYCTEFYWVCPSGLIGADEIADTCGLMWATKTGNRLYTKKKAPIRTVEIPESIYRYILMSRATIGYEYSSYRHAQTNEEFWNRWLVQKRVNRDLGHKVSKGLSRKFDEEIERVDRENAQLKRRIENIEAIEQKIEQAGLLPWMNEDQLRDKVNEFRQAIPQGLERDLENAKRGLCDVLDHLKELKITRQQLAQGRFNERSQRERTMVQGADNR